MNPRIAPEPPDSEVASTLLARYYQELVERFPGGFEPERTIAVSDEEMTFPFGAFLVAWLGEKAVGCGVVHKLDMDRAELKRMWVDPVVRGRGVGRALLAALESTASELGCSSVRLDTNAHLIEALTLYHSAGYTAISAYNDNPYAHHWFEKNLSNRPARD